ncbi:MAG: hypothetical protein AB1756_07690 [Acidobacteriota bacterium]
MNKISNLFVAGIFLLVASSSLTLADWTASGRFVYVDREFDEGGFTGSEPQLPIRFADLEVYDVNLKKSPVLARGSTDANGYYSISVPDTKIRTVAIRCITSSTQISDLFLSVKNKSSGNAKYYSIKTNNYSNHNPNANINAGTYSAVIGKGGEAFNIFDTGVRGIDYLKYLNGARPGSDKAITFIWALDGGITNSYYSNNRAYIRNTGGYDDTVILHEFGHHVVTHYSKSDSPGGSHTFLDCKEDIRLAFSEGYASFYAGATRAYYAFNKSNVYLRTDGGPGPGHVVRWFDYETKNQVSCDGDDNEVRVANCLWDIIDGPTTPDFDTGTEESHDLLAAMDGDVWEVMTDYIPTAANVSLEDFWDGWFSPSIANGFRPEMEQIFSQFLIEFFPDSAEENNSVSVAVRVEADGSLNHFTFFSDPERDGIGVADDDYFYFQAFDNTVYKIETINLLSDANTIVEIYDTDGTTLLGANDNRSDGDESSYLAWTAPRTDLFYIKVFHAPDSGIYGSYDLRIGP